MDISSVGERWWILTVLNPNPLELFRVTIFKSHVNRPSDTYANTWELQAADSPDLSLGLLNGVVNKIVDFERNMALDNIEFRRVVISTYAEEEGGYNPDQFLSRDLAGTGLRSGSDNDLPLQACLHVSRQVPTGRQGKLFLRGVLQETQVDSNAGEWVITSPTALDDLLSGAVNNSLLSDVLGGADPFFIVMVGRNKSGVQHIRTVVDLGVVGIAWVKLDHRYFNRSIVTPG